LLDAINEFSPESFVFTDRCVAVVECVELLMFRAVGKVGVYDFFEPCVVNL
jgi:hypothetical protein